MRRLLVVFLAVVVGLVFVSSLYAQSAEETMKGKAIKALSNIATTTPTPDVKTEASVKSDKPATKEVIGPCKQIIATCKNAGFVYGAYKKGNGLYVDCIDPIMQGKTFVPGSTKPLPTVDPKLITECKKKAPDFGSGRVGYKPTP